MVFKIVRKIIIYFLISSVGSVLLFRFLPIPFTLTMVSEKIERVKKNRTSKVYYDWEPYENISKELALAAIASEDQLFPTHSGFDFKSMRHAFRKNLQGKKVRGASTISQQVAKNVFLWQGRSYFRKILEAYFTVLIELFWSKKRILEVYLNVAEMGVNTFGAEEAAQRYFKKSAKNLTRNEAAKIAVILPSPSKWEVSHPGSYVSRRVQQIMTQMRALGGNAYLKKYKL